MEGKVKEEVMKSITEGLSSMEDLYFPRALLSSASHPSQRKSILLDLLFRVVTIFLETLMRRSEEAMLIAKIREEQWRQGVAEADWVGYERYRKQQEEGEVEKEEEEEVRSASCREQNVEMVSAEDMQDGMEQFTYIMQQKFLSGEDHQYLDYSKIDEDETLDDHWLREANHDAEEKCFAKY
ncbi:hypothetical protein SLEP1_g8988 [Rubroshorea leprosula]|uniref:CCD97-like C-terminal domain-containing protein n=1 Tax=Rubroshorea leprosula TaxID=152421 RepID=A0AAV5ICT2_9ROSI|nr:hypothetical protein SLEP1_g8988 [Rubroshorea leprosula]